MGLLSGDQERKCFLYLGYLEVNRTGVYVGGQPQTVETVQKLQTSLDNLTANGATSVTNILVILDGLYVKLQIVDTRFQASKAGKIELNAKEWSDRMVQWDFFRRQLAVQLDVAIDPYNEADSEGGGSAIQGPWREP